MNRRCFNCKKLEEESTVKFYARTKLNPDAVFLCKSCKKRKEPAIRKVYVRKSNIISDEERKKIEHLIRVQEGRKKRHMLNYGFVQNDDLTSDCEQDLEKQITPEFTQGLHMLLDRHKLF